jgi:hypothetical protein
MDFQDFKQLTIWSNEQKGKEKIHFSLGQSGKHYTLHFGCNSKIADLHSADERFQLGSPERYLTLFKISHFQILRLIIALRKQIPYFMQWLLRQEISVGFLKKRHILLLSMQSGNPFFDTTFKKKYRIKRKDFTEEDFLQSMINPCQLNSSVEGSFLAFSTRYGFLKQKGIVLKIKISENNFRLFWIDPKELSKIFEPAAKPYLYMNESVQNCVSG